MIIIIIIIGLVRLVPVFIVTVMFILNFVHFEITAYSDNKQSIILSYLICMANTIMTFRWA